jgi:hypothetical protein
MVGDTSGPPQTNAPAVLSSAARRVFLIVRKNQLSSLTFSVPVRTPRRVSAGFPLQSGGSSRYEPPLATKRSEIFPCAPRRP